MPFIHGVTEDSAKGLLADLFIADRTTWGYLPNFAMMFGLRPEVYQAWRHLNGAIKANMDPRRYELTTVAAATALRSSYCTLAHGRILAREFMSHQEVMDLVADPDAHTLAPVDRAVISLAGKIVRGAAEVSERDLVSLRDCGLSDEEIFDVVLAAAARSSSAKHWTRPERPRTRRWHSSRLRYVRLSLLAGRSIWQPILTTSPHEFTEP